MWCSASPMEIRSAFLGTPGSSGFGDPRLTFECSRSSSYAECAGSFQAACQHAITFRLGRTWQAECEVA